MNTILAPPSPFVCVTNYSSLVVGGNIIVGAHLFDLIFKIKNWEQNFDIYYKKYRLHFKMNLHKKSIFEQKATYVYLKIQILISVEKYFLG